MTGAGTTAGCKGLLGCLGQGRRESRLELVSELRPHNTSSSNEVADDIHTLKGWSYSSGPKETLCWVRGKTTAGQSECRPRRAGVLGRLPKCGPGRGQGARGGAVTCYEGHFYPGEGI